MVAGILTAAAIGLAGAGDAHEVARLTGPGSINATDRRWYVHGTDLGHMFEHRGRTYMVFGDTFGPPGKPPQFGEDWRSNVMAYGRDRDPRDGLTFDGMITDRPGHAKELIDQATVPGEEVTVIPTNGVSDGRRMYLHYMAVREWGPPGEWWLNRSGLAYSDDDGQTWELSDRIWDAGSGFGQVAFVEHGRHVYLFGIPGGRFGGARLARVERHALLRADRYEYWNGRRWVRDEAATTVVPAPVGELSVAWNRHHRRWLMMYLDDVADEVVLRTAKRLTGPWSEPQTVVTADQVPSLYAPYLHPRLSGGRDIYFTLSRFDQYDVFWWRTTVDTPSGAV